MQHFKVQTSHGTIHVVSAGSGDPAILLIHGNSANWRMFKHIFADERLTSSHRLVAFDLPGHGESSDALDPQRTYNMAAYGEVAIELLRQLQIASVIIFGSSLGGHVGIEMVEQLKDQNTILIKGLMICGSPPALGREQVAEGFNLDPDNNIAGSEELTDEAVEKFVGAGYRGEREQWQVDTLRRTDGRARKFMVEAFVRGRGADQRRVVAEATNVPLAVVNGSEDAFIKHDTIERLQYGNMWKGQCFRLPGLGHCPFWEKPDAFLPIFEEFVTDCSTNVRQ
ncbi:hypothetical protein VTN00DRAFT_10039 [Thermoascus crustaceus]|uniref:uncharacterized protein n=1 Tax=Thermoascus crustaceus TaxID=5088 RepID=UPI0037449A34